jgi:hypothetical protein
MLPAKKGPAATPAEAATAASPNSTTKPAEATKKDDDEEKEEGTPVGGITHVKKAKMARGARRAPIQKVSIFFLSFMVVGLLRCVLVRFG